MFRAKKKKDISRGALFRKANCGELVLVVGSSHHTSILPHQYTRVEYKDQVTKVTLIQTDY